MSKLGHILSTPTRDVLDLDAAAPTEGCREWCMPKIECADGASLSVQASRTHYCQPRDSRGPWYEVEVGYVENAEVPDSWREYADTGPDDEDWRASDVYGYVPVDLVRAFIESHGGEK